MTTPVKEVELMRTHGGITAESIVAALAGRGIPARIQYRESVGDVYRLTFGTLSEVSIVVPEERLEEAKALLAAAEKGELVLAEDDTEETDKANGPKTR